MTAIIKYEISQKDNMPCRIQVSDRGNFNMTSLRGLILRIQSSLSRSHNFIRKALPIISFTIPIAILYCLYPKTFEVTWIGRTYYLFFMWILFLETFIVSEKLNSRQISLKSLRGVALLVALAFPTVYVIAANFCGLNAAIENLAAREGVYFSNLMPVSVEYLVFMTFLAAIIALNFGVSGLADLSISAVFLGAIGGIYVLNNLFPFGRFAPLQMIVPTTAHLSMSFLNLLGYNTLFLGNQSNMPIFVAWDANKNYSAAYAIAWPCSGVESLIIYTITISLFLRKMPISWVGKAIYFGVGAVITYLINILRIATIFILSIQGGDVGTFHDYYGQLYSITWIISYPLIMIGTQALWSRIQSWRLAKDPQRIPTRKTAVSGPI